MSKITMNPRAFKTLEFVAVDGVDQVVLKVASVSKTKEVTVDLGDGLTSLITTDLAVKAGDSLVINRDLAVVEHRVFQPEAASKASREAPRGARSGCNGAHREA